MDKKKTRRRIIDSSVVPESRRTGEKPKEVSMDSHKSTYSEKTEGLSGDNDETFVISSRCQSENDVRKCPENKAVCEDEYPVADTACDIVGDACDENENNFDEDNKQSAEISDGNIAIKNNMTQKQHLGSQDVKGRNGLDIEIDTKELHDSRCKEADSVNMVDERGYTNSDEYVTVNFTDSDIDEIFDCLEEQTGKSSPLFTGVKMTLQNKEVERTKCNVDVPVVGIEPKPIDLLESIKKKCTDKNHSQEIMSNGSPKHTHSKLKGMSSNPLYTSYLQEQSYCESPLNFDLFENKQAKLQQLFGDEEIVSSISATSPLSTYTIDSLETIRCCKSPTNFFGESENDTIIAVNKGEKEETNCKVTNNVSPEFAFTQAHGLDPFSIELELTGRGRFGKENDKKEDFNAGRVESPVGQRYRDSTVGQRYRESPALEMLTMMTQELDEDTDQTFNEETAHLMDDGTGTPRLLSMEEKWQIIFNEKTRAPIYAVTQYIEYLSQFVNGQNAASRDNDDVIRRDSINPISYLLRKLKLDLKMSYESFLEEFIKPEMGGLGLLVRLLKSIQNAGARQSGSTNMAQLKHYKKTMTDEHDCLLCIKYSLRPKGSLSALLAVNYGLETVASSLLSTYTKSRGTAVEILTVAMSAVDGFSKVLDCFTYIQLKIGEPVRFKSLVNMMNMNSPQNVIFKVCGLKFVNTLLAAASNTNIRVFLQHELQNAGLDVPDMLQNTSGTGLEYDDLRHELEEWQRTFVDVDALIHQGTPRVYPDIANSHPKQVDDLQNQVKSLTEEKSLLERKLRAVSGELKRRHEEIRRRSMSGCDAFTQTYGPREADRESIGCQCGSNISSNSEDKRKTTAKYFGWKDVYISQNEDTTYYPSKQRSGADGRSEEQDADDADDDIPPTPDEQGLVKVKQWLKCHCSSSEVLVDGHRNMNGESEDQGHSNGLYFKRNSFTRKNVKKADFPGNWKIIPKSIEQFPARFSANKCHKSNCDRCELKLPSENINNLDQGQPEAVIHQASVELRLQELVTNKKRSDVRSQSSDSAIGGSGERLWNDRQITLLPTETSEAEILQELIQPDDSASGVPENEPYPDYSTVPNSPRNQESFMTELSSVLREFEGNLTRYEMPATVVKNVTSPQTSVETYVTLGDI